MRNVVRLAAVFLTLALAAACSSTDDPSSQPQGSSLTTNAPASGSPGTPAATPGQAMRSPAAPPESPSAGAAAGSAAPAARPAPAMMAMDVPAGTPLELTLESAVSSETSNPEQTVRARVAKPVVISGMTAIPEGAGVVGTVVSAERSGRVKGRASIAIRFHSVTVADTPYKITTARITRQAEATKGEDATKIGVGAGVGAAIGAIAGGKKGAAIGAGVGGGAGTGAVLATRGKEVTIPAGATLRTTIQETVRITAPMS